MTTKYKYLHILWHNTENTFLDDLVDSLNKAFPIDSDTNYFITPFQELYERIHAKHTNIEKVEDGNLINRYASYADYLVVHNLGCSLVQFLFSRKKNLAKVIWRTWGSDVPTIRKNAPFIRKTLKRIYLFLWKKKVLCMKAIACANLIDKYRFQQLFDNKLPYLYFSYTKYSSDSELVETERLLTCELSHSGVNILVGHSAYPMDKHLEILEMLYKYRKEKITVYINIVYGDDKYKQMVLDKLESNYGDESMKIIPVTERMEKKGYMSFLNEMDVCIMGMETSSALGNIANILFLKKKIFFSKTSEFAQALEAYGCTPAYYQDITELSFLDFCKKDDAEINLERSLIGFKPCYNVEQKYKNIYRIIESL